jgi:hypothetical protein
MASLLDNLKSGTRWGLAFAAFYSAAAVLIWLVRGDVAFEAQGTSLWQVLLAYVAGGMAAGVVVGLLMPLGRTRFGAGVIGFVAAVPVMFVVGMAVSPPPTWFTRVPIVAFGCAAILGPIVGIQFWNAARRN